MREHTKYVSVRHVTAREELASLPLHDRIAAVVDASGLSQDQFAERVGTTYETLSRWVNRRARPNRHFRQKLAEEASRVYDEPIPADLFRDRINQTVTIEEALMQLAEATTELIRLLGEQRQVVAQLQRFADSLGPPAGGEGSE